MHPDKEIFINHSIKVSNKKGTKVKLAMLRKLEQKVLWLSTWMIHHANHLRDKKDGLKVGGHQASSASLVSIMTILYFDILRPFDRVAVKPHASPVFHTIQYLLGNQKLEQLEKFRAYHGAQSYPSRTKDLDDVDFSTGSVGLGAAVTAFASLIQDYMRMKPFGKTETPEGRMIALVGDAELDEGNVYEALYECWKHGLRNTWWIIDYNRQSLDSVVSDRLFGQIDQLFRMMGWRILTLKYGKLLEGAFKKPGGLALKEWIDACPNSLYSALVFKGGEAWRSKLENDFNTKHNVRKLIECFSNDELQRLMTNLAGHDIEMLHETFQKLHGDLPTCVIAYTIKGYGLPFAGHKDNHAGIMNPKQIDKFRVQNKIRAGREWEPFEGLELPQEKISSFLNNVPFQNQGTRRYRDIKLEVPSMSVPKGKELLSTQEGFGRILSDLARSKEELVKRIVTTSPDVTVSTNLGGWINRKGIFNRNSIFNSKQESEIQSFQKWDQNPSGQHFELGIAENNLFLMLAAMGLSHELFGKRLIPIGTVYDPFIYRGLDALNYACYQDARFILVATPSGISLAPEGGAHQSIGTPLVGLAQDGLAAFEPSYVDELTAIMEWSFEYIQRDGSGESTSEWLRDSQGGSVYLRLSTRPIHQLERNLSFEERTAIIEGGYWVFEPETGAELALVYSGAVVQEVMEAFELIRRDIPGAGLLAVTSSDRLNAGWLAAKRSRHHGGPRTVSLVEKLLEPIAKNGTLVTILDGHPSTLSWLGGVRGHYVESLGVEHFGQSGSIDDLYRHYGLDTKTIIDACTSAYLNTLGYCDR